MSVGAGNPAGSPISGGPPAASAMDARGLRAGEVHLWWFDANAVPAGLEALDDAERAAADRLRRPEDRHRFLARRTARRLILARYVEADPAALAFDTTCRHCGAAHGKPRLLVDGAPVPVSFNASHAAGVGLLAVAWAREVGVDAEAPERVADAESVASRFFAAAERAALEADPGPETFLRAWSAKEAYLKLRGLGLAADLARLDTTAWHDAVPDPLEPGGSFWLLRPSLPPDARGVAVALAVDGVEPVPLRVAAWPTTAPSSG